MNQNTTISIVIAVYNIEKYLDKCLKSIKDQTYSNFICYCVNDGSTDNSESIINQYLVDSRFKLLNKENGGLSDARNYGLKYVDTEYVMFVDGDDYLEPDLLSKTIGELDNTKSDLLVFSYYQHYIDGPKEIVHLNKTNGTYKLEPNKELLSLTPNAAWNKVYRTKLFKDNNIEYPKGYRYEDLGTTPKLLLKANSIVYLDVPLYNYIINRPDNITSKVDEKIYDIIQMCTNIVEYYKENNKFNEYKEELNYLCSINLIQALRKVMTIKDKKFVNKFIDDIFEFKNKYSFYKINKYKEYLQKSDDIYLSKFKCKLYYLWRH